MIKEQIYNEIKSSNRPSLYADPLGWAVVDFLSVNFAGIVEKNNDNTGIIVVSDYCTQLTMKNLYPGIKKGYISPLKFAGANPGVMAGLPAIIYGLRGASMTLSMSPKFSYKAIYSLVKFLFKNDQVSSIFIILHDKCTEGDYFRGTYLDIKSLLNLDNILVDLMEIESGK